MEESRPYLVLGLDPGIASCGFCLLDMTNHKILEMGSHLFDAPQEDKTKVSLAVGRRSARSIRRNNERTKSRQKHCLRLLIDAGLLPEDASKKSLQSRKGDKPLLKLRAVGLDRLLSDREFSQVLYSLSGRRGYIPHGIGRVSEVVTDVASDDDGKVLKAVAENSKLLNEGGYRTVGEMLYRNGSSRNKGGNYDHCVLNSQIVSEVRALFESQRSFGNAKATADLEGNYIKCLCWEKSTLDYDERVYSLVGTCSYFPEERRAANADVSSELCRAYERLGHVTIVNVDGTTSYLSNELIAKYLGILFSPVKIKGNVECKVRYSNIRKDLDLTAKAYFKGVDPEKENKEEVFAPKAWRLMRKKGMPEALLARMFEDRAFGDAVCEALTFASKEESLHYRLEPLGLSEEDEEAILSMPFSGKVFKGYGSRSLKALEMLLDAFEDEEVRTLTQAEEASGLLAYRLNDNCEKFEILPPYKAYDPTCNNPVVLRAMGRMRHIVNSIIRIHGVPDEIHIELGRELKQSKREKLGIAKAQKANKANNERWAKTAAEILGIEPEEVKGKVLRKLALREEQGEKDAYTNETIDLERLVREDRYCEIDHVLPYSRTSDDSKRNKVLVLASSNQNKKERTPYEWMTSGELGAPSWEEFSARVHAIPGLRKKARYLLNTDLGEEQQRAFINRNLNDDRYMSRAVKSYLEDSLIFPEDGRKRHVMAVAGGATANLRWVWGMNTGDKNTKDRGDDRHHAVDAAIIAACSESTVIKVAKARSKGRETFKHIKNDRLADTQPWESFAQDVMERRERVIPTRMVNHGVTGRVFEDTIYKYAGINDKGYPLVEDKSGEKKSKGNVVMSEDGKSLQLVDGMAFLRLWLDPTGEKGAGKWYAEPVYYADIPFLDSDEYVPRAIVRNKPRSDWGPVPLKALECTPVILRRGDVLMIDDRLGRYWSINISNFRLSIKELLVGEEITKGFPTVGSLRTDTKVEVIKEDCLGHCYDGIALSPDDPTLIVQDD